jgi:pyrroloquinoline quinone biosynthesis protein D
VAPDSIPTIWRLARITFDPVRQQSVLLYPEGTVLLNPTAAAILELCDGDRSIRDIAAILEQRYQCEVLADVTSCLEQLAEREFVHDRRPPDNTAG